MASLSHFLGKFPKICSSKEYHPRKHNLRLNMVHINSTSRLPSTTKANEFNITQNGHIKYGVIEEAQNGHALKKDLNQGVLFDGSKYRQSYIIRSTEVGPNKAATFENILNLLQETGLNHVAMIGLSDDEYGATNEMIRNNIIWVVTRMVVEVDHYPKWGQKIDIETWIAPLTKNSVQRESLVYCNATGLLLARAASNWVLMDCKTRRLSKISEVVRTELSPLLIDKPMTTYDYEKIDKLPIDGAKYLISNLKPRSGDMDLNNHVNNVKYIKWILEVIPDIIQKTHQLSSVVLEYRKECGSSDSVESLSEPYDDGVLGDEYNEGKLRYTHLLQIKGETKNEEILRGRTTWKKNIIAPNILGH